MPHFLRDKGAVPAWTDLPSPIASVHDPNRTYGTIQLANGVIVGIVSDPSASTSAAAAYVSSGSVDDPPALPGLSVLLAFHLFDAAPDYTSLISDKGGYVNGNFSFESVSVYHEIAADKADEALQHLIDSYFASPSFSNESRAAALAVTSSLAQSTAALDEPRVEAVLRATAKPGSPWRTLGLTNEAVLAPVLGQAGKADDPLRLHFRRHWHAGSTFAAVGGPQSVEELKVLASEYYGQIPSRERDARQTKAQDASADFDIFGDSSVETDPSDHWGAFDLPGYMYVGGYVPAPRVMRVESSGLLELQVWWAFPAAEEKPFGLEAYPWAQRPVSVVRRMLESKHDGGLWSALTSAGLATDFDCYYRLDSLLSTINCNAELTEAGVERSDEVIAIIHAYRAALASASSDEIVAQAEDYFQGVRSYFDVSYTPSDLLGEVQKFSAALQRGEQPEILHGIPSDQYWSVGEAAIRAYLDAMTPAKAVAIIVSPDALNATANASILTEPYYGGRFVQRAASDAELAAWTATPSPSEFILPPPNPYHPMAADLVIVSPEGADGSVALAQGDANGAHVWAAPDRRYASSRFNLRCELSVPALALVTDDFDTRVKAELFFDAMDLITETAVQDVARDADLFVGAYADLHGVRVYALGTRPSLDAALSDFLESLLAAEITESGVRTAIAKQRAGAIEDLDGPLYRQAYRLVSEMLDEGTVSAQEYLTVCDEVESALNVGTAPLTALGGAPLPAPVGSAVDCVAHNNVDDAGATSVAAEIVAATVTGGTAGSTRPDHRGRRLPPAGQSVVRLASPRERGGALDAAPRESLVYIDATYVSASAYGSSGYAKDVLVWQQLYGSLLSQSLYEQLRVVESIGYAVWTRQEARPSDLLSAMLLVHSVDHNATYLSERVDAWLSEVATPLVESCNVSGGNNTLLAPGWRESLRQEITMRPDSDEIAARVAFGSLLNDLESPIFDVKEMQASVLDDITCADFAAAFYNGVRPGGAGRSLRLLVDPVSEAPDGGWTAPGVNEVLAAGNTAAQPLAAWLETLPLHS